MKIRLIGLVVAILLARGAGAQSPSRPPAAKTPVVAYRIAQAKSADTFTLDARKIIRGEEEERVPADNAFP